MNRVFYLVALLTGIGIFVFYYMFNFNNMSETELINKVLYWYTPLIFGIFGLTALRLKKRMGPDSSAIKFMFSGNDMGLTVWSIVLAIATGLVGLILFLIPLSLIQPKTNSYDVYMALAGTIVWLLALWAFFVLLWPSL